MGVNFSVFDIGRKALRASQLGVAVTSHNIANVNTPGYSRQGVQLSPDPALPLGGQLIGTGVRIDGVKSFRDKFIETRLQTETGINGRLTAQRDTLTAVDNTFNELDGTGGINRTLQNFFGSFRDLEANPSAVALRTSVVERGKSLAYAFHTTNDRLVETRHSADQDIRTTVEKVNGLTEQIATLNQKIRLAESVGDPTGDLEDQRATAVNQVAEFTGARSAVNTDGTISFTLNDGQPLVFGDQAVKLTIEDAPPNGLAVIKLNGQVADISDGRLRGLLNSINDINGFIQSLDELAASIATRVNTLHAAGIDAQGNAGVNFFAPSQGATINAATFDVSAALKADARRVVATPSGAGLGDGTVARNIANLLSDPTSVAGTKTGSFTTLYGLIVTQAGEAAKTAETDLTTQAAILSQTQAQRDAVSGVSLDDEAINLLQYQKAYEAAARFLKIADEMTQTILQLGQ
ncbi:MAG: flagellar hook-associated protein FlgK [Blastocatellia bacterium]